MHPAVEIGSYVVAAVAFIVIMILAYDGVLNAVVEMALQQFPEHQYAGISTIRRKTVLTKDRTVLDALKRMQKSGKVECLHTNGEITAARLTALARARLPEYS